MYLESYKNYEIVDENFFFKYLDRSEKYKYSISTFPQSDAECRPLEKYISKYITPLMEHGHYRRRLHIRPT